MLLQAESYSALGTLVYERVSSKENPPHSPLIKNGLKGGKKLRERPIIVSKNEKGSLHAPHPPSILSDKLVKLCDAIRQHVHSMKYHLFDT